MKFKNSIEKRISGKHKESIRMFNFSGKSILDVGCSIGIFEKYVSKKAKKILAIDINKKDIKIAKKTEDKNVKFLERGVFDLDREKFDAVVMFDVIEHLPEDREEEALRKLGEILDKRGILIITTPCSNFTNFLDPAWYFGHRHYKEEKLIKILRKVGFRIKKIYSRGGIFEISSMFLFYIYKWFFNSEIPFKGFFDKKRDEEYNKKGFVTWFIVAEKD